MVKFFQGIDSWCDQYLSALCIKAYVGKERGHNGGTLQHGSLVLYNIRVTQYILTAAGGNDGVPGKGGSC